jgi:hypothetical protein
VRTLQEKGTRVVFSVFDSGTPAGWRENHPEIGYVLHDGTRHTRICPWKRLADGSLYETFFAEQLQRVIRDYGFDGFHGADGWSHPRFPLHQADFSDDMAGQFEAYSGITLPEPLSCPLDGDHEGISNRAAWIWTQLRREWIDFHRHRLQTFWRRVAAAVHDENGVLALNTCWTRDPFEAACRFGADYRLLADAGADAFIVEAAGAVQELGGDLPYGSAYGRTFDDWDPSRILCRFQTTVMQVKAAVPDKAVVFLNGIKDTNEIWNGLRHAPANVESEITMHGNVFIRRTGNGLARCANGPVVCLADGIRAHEWAWLKQVWQRAYSGQPENAPGATVIWSDNAEANQLNSYLETRHRPYGRLLFDLVAHGAPIFTIQRIDDLADTSDTLVVIHPQLLPRNELLTVFRCARGPLVLIGPPIAEPPQPPTYAATDTVSGLAVQLFGTNPTPETPSQPSGEPPAKPPFDAPEPPSWIYELPAVQVPDGFLQTCADLIADVSRAPFVTENSDAVRVWAVENRDGTLRLFIRNDEFYYRVARVDMRRAIASIQVRTEFPGSPITFSGTSFHVKVPGKGVVIADITCR